MSLYPESPTPMSYAAGVADFSPIGNLANDYYKGQEQKRDFNLKRTFKDGLPRDAAGNIDFNRAAEMLAVQGDASQLVPLANVDLQRKFMGSALSDANTAFPTGQPQPGAAPAAASPAPAPSTYSDRTASVESGGNPTAKNPNSSASGTHQFLDSTWIENFDKTFPQAAKLTPQQKLAVRDNPQLREAQEKVFQTFTASNESALRDAGVPVNDTTRYAAHFFGAGDAPKVMTAEANTPLSEIVSPASIKANPFLRGMTAGDARNWLARKMPSGEGGEQSASAFAPPERPAIPPTGVPKGDPSGKPPEQPNQPMRVAGPVPAPVAAAAPAGQPAPAQAVPPPQAAPAAQPAPAVAPMPAALRPLIPPQFNDPMQYVNFLRQKQASYEAAGLAGIKGADGAAKAYGAQADKVMDAIGKYYELTPDQKNAVASGGLTPLGLKNAEQQGRVAAENEALTPEAKNFNFDQRRTGGTSAGQPVHGEEAGPQTLVEHQARAAGEKKFAEGEAERYGKKYDTIQEIGTRAVVDKPQLQLAKTLMADPNYMSGVGEKYNLIYKNLLSQFGGDPNVAVPQEAFRKIISNSILDQIKGLAGTGPVRVAEMNIIRDASASQNNSPQSNRLLVEIAERLQTRAADMMAMAQNYKNGRLDSGFDRLVRLYDEGKLPEQAVKAYGLQRQGSLFTPDEIKDFRKIIGEKPDVATAAGAKGAQAGPKAPAVGHIEDGHRFKGGNPAKSENWERVQ